MGTRDQVTARRQLDKRLTPLRKAEGWARPSRGWIKAIREALGMTTAQLAGRIGVSQPRAVAIEQAERTGALTLDSLERAARALDCELVYALVPHRPLEEMVEERARLNAERRLARIRHTMTLEDQPVTAADEQRQLDDLVRRLLEKPGSSLWNDETAHRR